MGMRRFLALKHKPIRVRRSKLYFGASLASNEEDKDEKNEENTRRAETKAQN